MLTWIKNALERQAMMVNFEKLHSFCCPDAAPARVRERLPGRLAVVFFDRLSTGVFDQHRRQSVGVFHRVDGNGRHTLAERVPCRAFCRAAADTSDDRLRVDSDGQYIVAQPVRAHAKRRDRIEREHPAKAFGLFKQHPRCDNAAGRMGGEMAEPDI